MHRVDPLKTLDSAILDVDVELRARSLRAAGELARNDLLPVCQEALKDEDAQCRFWAAWSAVLLGNRRSAVDALKTIALAPGAFRDRALQLVLEVMERGDAHAFLQALSPDSNNTRLLVKYSGIVGDPIYALAHKAHDDARARAGGRRVIQLYHRRRHRLRRAGRHAAGERRIGPNDDPNDDNVDMDLDDNLAWPESVKIQKWWDANKHNFKNGVRYFMGKPVSIEHCKEVLKNRYQRQRIAAALYLSLQQPGTPVFQTGAPGWRQKRWCERL
jgi:uncharacterized protein (TIGR02270 family)